MLHPRGLGPTPLRNVKGGLHLGLSEPPCGLRPCASSPMVSPGELIPGTRKQHQTLRMILSPNLPVTANISPHTQKCAGAHDRETLRTAAQHKRPVNLLFPTSCLNRLSSTRGPAKITSPLIQQLTNSPPKSHRTHIPIKRKERAVC